jgi:hypothetical protein
MALGNAFRHIEFLEKLSKTIAVDGFIKVPADNYAVAGFVPFLKKLSEVIKVNLSWAALNIKIEESSNLLLVSGGGTSIPYGSIYCKDPGYGTVLSANRNPAPTTKFSFVLTQLWMQNVNGPTHPVMVPPYWVAVPMGVSVLLLLETKRDASSLGRNR